MVDAMAALRLDLIGRYLRPHRRTVLLGAFALVIVNLLGVTIEEVRSAVDELQGDSMQKSAAGRLDRPAGKCDGRGPLFSRQLVFGVGRQVEVELRQRCLITCSGRSLPGFRAPAAAR